MRFSSTKLLGLVLFGVAALSGQDKIPPPRTPQTAFVTNTFSGVVKAKASADECYLSLGNNIQYDFIDQVNPAVPCGAGKKPKVNQGYVWGSAVVGTTIYFGTIANALCLVAGSFVSDPNALVPYERSAYACEFGSSPYVPTPISSKHLGDYRVPRMYKFETTTGAITDITPKAANPGACVVATNPICVEPLLSATQGIRAVGPHPTDADLVIFAGPSLSAAGGVNFFLYKISTNSWIAKAPTNQYNNIRRFVTLNAGTANVLYTAVGNTAAFAANPGKGSVLRYAGVIPTTFSAPAAGSSIPVCLACFTFQVVGTLDGDGAYLAVHNSRLYVTTWPRSSVAGLFMSPAVPAGGLTTANAAGWTKVWNAGEYEPDTVIRGTYGGGALASFGGYLYWGTMHVPYAATAAMTAVYGVPTTNAELAALLVNTFRTATVFRGKDFETGSPVKQLLYGESTLPVYVPAVGSTPASWVQTTTGNTALYGRSGFGNPYNNYIWTMTVFNTKLYVGTMDWSHLAALDLQAYNVNISNLIPVKSFGADLYLFNNTTSAAVADSTTGVGNYTNYGIRSLVPANNKLYIGTANPMNLLTNLTDAIPDGGWELIQLTPRGGTVVR
jgi:hypothetical protein